MSLETFSTYVNAELPRRVAVLTEDITGWDNTPNSVSAPDVVNSAPKGTLFLQETESLLWQKLSPLPRTWQLVGGSTIVSGEATITSGTLTKTITIVSATADSKVVISWLGDHGATRSWVTRPISPDTGWFTVNLASAAAANTSFMWEIL